MAQTTIGSPIDVTIVLLGHEELDQRSRALDYYRQAGVPCIALEALRSTSSGRDCRERLQLALEQVQTPYVGLALDGDFVLPTALRGLQASLQTQPGAVAAQGYALAYQAGNSAVSYHRVGLSLGDAGQGARGRVEQYARAAQHAWRAVQSVGALRDALALLPDELDFAGFRVALSYAVLTAGEVRQLDQVDVVSESQDCQLSEPMLEECLNQTVHALRQWDAAHRGLCTDEESVALLNQFVRTLYGEFDGELLFTSDWRSVSSEPERLFEPRQYLSLPYYSPHLHRQLAELEFLIHAWPAGSRQHQACEGVWVRQQELLHEHANDTPESLQLRYWQALSLGLFDMQVCERLAATLTQDDDGERAGELARWIARLQQVAGIAEQPRLLATESGRVLAALAAATPDAHQSQQALARIGALPRGQLAFVVLDLSDDDLGLQATFDSLLATGVRDFKLVVLKAGKPPVITTGRDTLHFIRVTDANWVAHLNQSLHQLTCEWVMLLEAGDQLLKGGLQHMLVELAAAPACAAICAGEVQRDEQGRLRAIDRPGADLNLLRGQPDLMSRHWLLHRQAVLDVGGYDETCREALDLDLLLRLVESHGVAGLASLDDYLVIGRQPSQRLSEEATSVVNRHLTRLGYRAQLKHLEGIGLSIDMRHASTPLVSILVVGEGDLAQLQVCLTSVLQRTRYPRFEVLVACADDGVVAGQAFARRVRLLVGEPGASRSALLSLAASQARGEYLLSLSVRCQVVTPAWIEALLNEAQRPEVGVTGGLLLATDGSLAHAGYALAAGPQVLSPWAGLEQDEVSRVRWPQAVRGCQAVSADCLMVRKDIFEQYDATPDLLGSDIGLCLAAAEMGQMVVWAPGAQLLIDGPVSAVHDALPALAARWPEAFSQPAQAQPLAWLASLA
jgi:hypothetical protein